MAISSLGITLDERDSIELSASRSEQTAWMRIHFGPGYCEIYIEREHVQALRDQLPGVLADLDRAATGDEVCGRAEIVSDQAANAAGRARKLADVASKAGAPEVAAALLAAAEETTATATAVDAAIQAVQSATADADTAADRLVYTTQLATTTLHEAPNAAGDAR